MAASKERGEGLSGPVGPLVSTEWLAAHLHDPDVRVVDVRWYLPAAGKQGREEYARGHLPGAVFVDLDRELAGPRGSGAGRHPLPSAEAFGEAMGRAGIGERTQVVVYDDAGGSIAARLWWLLRHFGHQQVAVLDGGIGRWQAEGRPVETVAPAVAPALFHARLPADGGAWLVDKQRVDALRRDPAALVLDARAPERYEGRTEPVDPRAGHIPGARSAPFARNLRDEEAPRLKPAGELRAQFEALGVPHAQSVVTYCGSGVTACHNILALEVAGFPQALLYAGSWSDWSADAALPAATGAEPG